MSGLRFRVSAVVVRVSVMMGRVVIVVPPPPHFRGRYGTLHAGHGLQHSLQGVTVQTHGVLPVHVLGAFALVPAVGQVVVEEVVVVGT